MPFAFYYLHCNIYIYVDWNHVLHDEQHWKMFKNVNSLAVTIHWSEIRNCPNFNSAHQHSIIWQLAIAKLNIPVCLLQKFYLVILPVFGAWSKQSEATANKKIVLFIFIPVEYERSWSIYTTPLLSCVTFQLMCRYVTDTHHSVTQSKIPYLTFLKRRWL